MLVNSGRDKNAIAIAGGGPAVGEAGTATSTSATSLTKTAAGWTTDAFKGNVVVTVSAYGVIMTNSATVLTVDRWYNPASPTGAAASTPSGTGTYVILGWAAPAFYTAITTNATAAAGADTTL